MGQHERIGSIISIHALTRSATEIAQMDITGFEFQSTHSRGVRRDEGIKFRPRYLISIHALTRSATVDLDDLNNTILISIHALTRSATNFMAIVGKPFMISIHALTRSATCG